MQQPAAFHRRDWLVLLVIWLLSAGTLWARSFLGDAGGPFFYDTDDAMRMVVARDFVEGQNWYDLVQHRLNARYGAEIHWSRLVDVPLAALLFLSGLVLPPAQAIIVASTIWPLLLLAVLLFLSARLACELVGRDGLLPALLLPVLSPAVLAEFSPGRVDHHNVVILLTLACLLTALVALRRSFAAWLCGLFAATALAVAIEAVPLVVAAILAFGLAYAADPARAANLRRFGLGFALGLVVHLIVARPPSRWLEAACDMISPVYALAGLAVGAACLVVSLLPAPQAAWRRLLLLAVFGMVAGAVVALVFPQCLSGPYGQLDPWLQQHWIAAIVEAKPWHVSLGDLPVYSIVVATPVLLGLLAALLALWKDQERRLSWLILLVFLVCATLVMLAQVRGARLAVLPAIPAASWLIVLLVKAYLERPGFTRALGLLGSVLAFSGIVLSLLVTAVLDILPHGRSQAMAETRASKLPCLAEASYAGLAAMPAQRLMAPIDMGSHLLLYTPHSVVAAPYHRNEAGVLDAFRFFNRPVEDALNIAQARGLTMLVTCDAMPEMYGSGRHSDGTVLSLLAAGTPPAWLQPVSADGPLRLYAILP